MTLNDKKELDIIVEKITKTVNAEEMYLFGSFAEGCEKEDSDFDIYVVLNKNEERPIKAMQKINFALSVLDIRSVDILANYKDVFLNSAEDFTIERKIMERGIKIYDCEKQQPKKMA